MLFRAAKLFRGLLPSPSPARRSTPLGGWMLLRRTARSLSSRAAESSRPAGSPGASGFLAYRRRVPGKKKAGKALQVLPPLGGRVSVHMMASIHDSAELVDTLRARFPSGVVQRESPCAALCARRCRSPPLPLTPEPFCEAVLRAACGASGASNALGAGGGSGASLVGVGHSIGGTALVLAELARPGTLPP